MQLDVIERVVVLRSNPDEVVLTPFMGVGSEVYAALQNNRKAVGIELKSAYYKQAVKNVEHAIEHRYEQDNLLASLPEFDSLAAEMEIAA